MKRIGWMGWLVTSLLLLQNAQTGLAAPTYGNPLEGHLLQHSTGAFYVYHAGLRFKIESADVGDQVIEAIPTASSAEWQALFGAVPALRPAVPPAVPEPFPGYS